MSYQVVMNDAKVKQAVKAIEASGIVFDAFVGIGTSGALVAPVLAYAMKKEIVLVRKSANESEHSNYPLVGDIGNLAYSDQRLIFADDFVASGASLRKVIRTLRDKAPRSKVVGVFEANASQVTALPTTTRYGMKHLDRE